MQAKAFILFAAVFLIFFKSFGDDTNRIDIALGGSENVAIIANPDSVKAWRTLGSVKEEQYEQQKRSERGEPHYSLADFYTKSGPPILVSTNLASKLSQLLLNKDYDPVNGWTKDCAAAPAVVVTFSKGNKDVDVFFCFDCNIMSVKPVDQAIRMKHNSGMERIEHDFDSERPAFLQIIKKILPDDSLIQSLKDSDS